MKEVKNLGCILNNRIFAMIKVRYIGTGNSGTFFRF